MSDIVKCCNTCAHCDVLNCFCNVHFKVVRLEEVCDRWDEPQMPSGGYLSEEDEKKYRESVNRLFKPIIIRCKNCKHSKLILKPVGAFHIYKCLKWNSYHREEWYCADGELKKEGNSDARQSEDN